jgi:L-ribulose-5-phosphate 3-epimerase
MARGESDALGYSPFLHRRDCLNGHRKPEFARACIRGESQVQGGSYGLEPESGRQDRSHLLARQLGFDGIQISAVRDNDKLALSDPALQKAYLDKSQREGLKIASMCPDSLRQNYLKSDPLGQRWVADSISIAKAMGVCVLLLPFFGKGAMETDAEMDKVADVLKELTPAAEKAGVVLGLETTLSARDNVRIMDRTQSSAVLTYYDVGNSTNNGFDVVKEIRWLLRPTRGTPVKWTGNLERGTIGFTSTSPIAGFTSPQLRPKL